MLRFALTIFLSAFLLFQVQPVIARYILPWYGGTSMVWTVCLLFFQVSLLAGYSYAHALSLLPKTRHQAIIHLILVVCALATLPITPESDLKPDTLDTPLTSILFLLTTSIGIPYLLLSASGPLLQHWFKYSFPHTSPFRLYALSNVGSLTGLLSYPFLVEPTMTLQMQTWSWSIGFVIFALMCCSCAWSVCTANIINNENQYSPIIRSPLAGLSERILWILLPCSASTLLLASTNQISQDIASVPFLWLLPLSLYLLSFIICFDKEKWYDRRFWIPLLCVSSAMTIYVQALKSNSTILFQISVYSSLLFCACMVCHGELARIKPHPDRLTGFYLFIAFGGALGGIFVTLIAPLIFAGYWELQLAWIAVFIILGACLFSGQLTGSHRSIIIKQTVWALLSGTIALILTLQISIWDNEVIYVQRNFYGVLRVKETESGGESPLRYRSLVNGAILHGSQRITDQESRLVPTTYYGTESGIGVAIHEHPQHGIESDIHGKFRIGVVGMGVGTIASLCSKNDLVRFYEINPQVIEASQKYFTFLDDTSAQWQIVRGDARLSLEDEIHNGNNQVFDVLAIDAFSGDAIPVHLLTIESFELYWKHLKDDGILAVHTSNRHLDLTQVVRLAAKSLDKQVVKITNDNNDEYSTTKAIWMLMTNNQDFLQAQRVIEKSGKDKEVIINTKLWTDNYSNLFEVLR